MAEIADDHMSLITEEMMSCDLIITPTIQKKTPKQKPEPDTVDWDAYFERSKKNLAPSIAARRKLLTGNSP